MSAFHLFERYGIELEYMIVDRDSLAVKPICDELFRQVTGEITSDVERGDITWSNELVTHVVELKTTEPARALSGLAAAFDREVRGVNDALAALDARLLPGAMHPWMAPEAETRLWPHDNQEVYAAFDRIFDCRGHGWSNLQSMHINLPFANDGEFGRLHAAVRAVLPILPALAASSPYVEGRRAANLDQRLAVYRDNARKLPIVSGRVIPEACFTRADYERDILTPLYAALAPHDAEGILQDEWANARGAIARFSRGSIEIRVLDVQETPRADLALAALIVETVRALADERWTDLATLRALDVDPLARLLWSTTRDSEQATVSDARYAELFGATSPRVRTAGDLWRHISSRLLRDEAARSGADEPAHLAPHADTLSRLLDHGSLASRLVSVLGPAPTHTALRDVYGELADCLTEGRLFLPKRRGAG